MLGVKDVMSIIIMRDESRFLACYKNTRMSIL
jgi:hypothetical protein